MSHSPRAGFHPFRALLFLLAAQLFFTLLDASVKRLAEDIAVPIVAFARHTGQAILMLLVFGPIVGRTLVRSARWDLQIYRGIVMGCFTLFFIAALYRLAQAEATAIIFIAPFVVMLLAGPMLGETVTWVRWAGAAVGFLGMLAVVRPGSALDPLGLFFALLTAGCNVAFQLLTRKLAPIDDSLTTIFLSATIGAAVSALVLPFLGLWGDEWPGALTGFELALLLSLGFTGAVGQWCFVRAYVWSSASFIAPLVFLHLLWAVVAGYVFFDELPDAVSLAGMLLIVLGGAGTVAGEVRARLGRRARQAS